MCSGAKATFSRTATVAVLWLMPSTSSDIGNRPENKVGILLGNPGITPPQRFQGLGITQKTSCLHDHSWSSRDCDPDIGVAILRACLLFCSSTVVLHRLNPRRCPACMP